MGFWTGEVVLLTLGGLLFLCLLLYTSFSASGKKIRSEDEVWDETLSEGNAEPPKWWFFLFLGMIIISCVYLVHYPGLGSYREVLAWTQYKQYQQAEELYNERFQTSHNQWAQASFVDLAANEQAMNTAANLFIDNCSSCHGRDGTGQANMFPDLTDDVWQWGDTAEQIHMSIAQGRQAVMTSQLAQLGGPQGVAAMADNVRALAGLAQPVATDVASAVAFAPVCSACHGVNAKGNPALGAPNLTDGTWLYGSDREDIIATLTYGRNGVMPAQEQRLGIARTRLLAAWVIAGQVAEMIR